MAVKQRRTSPCDGHPNNVRFYQIAGLTIRVEADLPMTDATFHSKFKTFQVHSPGEDTIVLRHRFGLPDIRSLHPKDLIYRKPPWAIYRKENSWVYASISDGLLARMARVWPRIWRPFPYLPASRSETPKPLGHASPHPENDIRVHQLAVFGQGHANITIYNRKEKLFRRGNLDSLTLFPTDQILLARVFASRKGCYIHAAGAVLGGGGLLFVGHSRAGKSTLASLLRNDAEILCDDRIVVRKWEEGFRIHGTWSHGNVSSVSAGSAPLKAILFLQQDQANRLVPVQEKHDSIKRLLGCVIRPLTTENWWAETFTLVESLAGQVPCYILHFDRTGNVVNVLRDIRSLTGAKAGT